VLAQGEDIVPIPGTKHVRYLEENVRALDIVLTGEEAEQLRSTFSPGAAAGERYPAHAMKSLRL
jgi:aryl-alcohol dehydrogenase-like predicted oxidoreductase